MDCHLYARIANAITLKIRYKINTYTVQNVVHTFVLCAVSKT